MPNFKVPVRSEDADEMARALEGAGLTKSGLASGVAGDAESFSGRMTVVLEAADEAAAEARVREAVGEGPEVGPAKRAGSRG